MEDAHTFMMTLKEMLTLVHQTKILLKESRKILNRKHGTNVRWIMNVDNV